jgi:amino acid adenylation domain-containing protein
VLERQLEYWRAKLVGAPALLELPTDRPRSPLHGTSGAYVATALPVELADKLRTLSRDVNATLFMTLLAGFKALLSRYARSDDIVVGTPTAGRTRPELEELVGFFVNTLALRTDLSGDPTFRELVARVRETSLGAYAHQDLPFEKLVEDLRPERDLSHNPIFQVFFNLDNITEGRMKMAGLEVESVGLSQVRTKFDLTLYVAERVSGIQLKLVYSTDLFDEATAERILEQLQVLLERAADAPDLPLGAISLRTPRDRRVLPDPAAPIASPVDVGAIFDPFVGLAAVRPDALAVEDTHVALTYGELDRASNRLANSLLELGLERAQTVAVLANPSADLLVALLGVLKAAGAFLVLDPEYPPQRLARMVASASPALLLDAYEDPGATAAICALLPPDTSLATLRLDDPRVARASQAVPPVTVSAADRAYIAFTSGSTGAPLAVSGRHGPVAHFLDWHAGSFDFHPGDRFSLLSGLSHDPLLRDVFAPLSVGASLHVPPPDARRRAGALADWARDVGITVAHLTPATAELLCIAADGETLALRWACFGGDRLRYGDVHRLCAIAPACRVVNFYGATETPQAAGFHLVERPEERAAFEPVPIGRGIDAVDLLVMGPGGAPCAVGEPGEIWVRTHYLTDGYLGAPERTQERFVTFEGGGAPSYRTGDVGRYLADGAVEYLGRSDRQVKVRGFRVEPAEVEAALLELPAVRDAAVVAHEASGGNLLIAYVVGENADATSPIELRHALRERLPEYMIPVTFVELERLPLTPNGKLDYEALPQADMGNDFGAASYVPPRDELELQLVQLWESLLGVKPIGVRDDFFEVGGHSLAAVRFFARLEKELGMSLPLVTLFQAPTVERIAEILRQDGWEAPWSSLVAIQPGGSKPPFYCVHAGGVNVLFYRDLARRLGPDQPLYAFQPQGLDGKRPRHTRIEEMAAHYIAEMRTLQPEGPYSIGGASLGGVIAVEMACQLLEQGAEVGLVALFDTRGPGYPKLLAGTHKVRLAAAEHARRLRHHVRSFRLLEPGQRPAFIHEKAEKGWKKIRRTYIYKKKDLLRKLYGLMHRPLPKSLERSKRVLRQAKRAYTQRVYPGKITLFRASNQPLGIVPDPTLGWAPFAGGGLEIHEVPGFHGDIVREPHVRMMIEALRKGLEEATLTETEPKPAPVTLATHAAR